MIRVQVTISEEINGEDVYSELSFHVPVDQRHLAEEIIDKANTVRLAVVKTSSGANGNGDAIDE